MENRSVISFKYSQAKIAVDDIVLVRVDSIEELGCMCTTLEYPNSNAFMFAQHRRRLHCKPSRIVIGGIYFAPIRRIDPEHGYVDLGRPLTFSPKDKEKKRELMASYIDGMMITLFSQDLAMLTFQPYDTILAMLCLLRASHASVYDALLELAWIPERNMLQSPVLANVLNIFKGMSHSMLVWISQVANEQCVDMIDSTHFPMTLMKLVKFAFRAFLKNSKFCVHLRIRAPSGGIEAIKLALKSAQEFFLQRYGFPLEVVYHQESSYCLSFVSKSLGVANEMADSIEKHLQEMLGNDDRCDSLGLTFYSDGHKKEDKEDEEKEENSESTTEPKSNAFPPFFYDDGVFYILLVPYLFQHYFPGEFIDDFLVKSIVKGIINIATGCNNFSICRDASYDTMFLDDAILSALVWSSISANETRQRG